MPSGADRAKEAAAKSAVQAIGGERHIALGTGSTASFAVRAIAERFPGGTGFDFVASSRATEELARSLGLPIRSLRAEDHFELMLDGADEVSPQLDLTKGGGGALFREKFLARLSDRLVILVDPSKLVDHLGTRHRIPVEVVPFACEVVCHRLTEEGFDVGRRLDPRGHPFFTDNGNEVLDLRPSEPVTDPSALDAALRVHPGVVETGIFPGMTDRAVIGFEDGHVEERTRPQDASRRR